MTSRSIAVIGAGIWSLAAARERAGAGLAVISFAKSGGLSRLMATRR